MASVFTQIINGELPAWKVAETGNYLAFLDIRPVTRGHVLVIPKQEVDNLFTLEEDVYVGLMLFAKVVADAIAKVVPCARVGMAVVGLEVPHAHVHLIPVNQVSDLSFDNPRVGLTEDEFAALAQQIAAAI